MKKEERLHYVCSRCHAEGDFMDGDWIVCRDIKGGPDNALCPRCICELAKFLGIEDEESGCINILETLY